MNFGTVEPSNPRHLGTLEPWHLGTLAPWNLLMGLTLLPLGATVVVQCFALRPRVTVAPVPARLGMPGRCGSVASDLRSATSAGSSPRIGPRFAGFSVLTTS